MLVYMNLSGVRAVLRRDVSFSAFGLHRISRGARSGLDRKTATGAVQASCAALRQAPRPAWSGTALRQAQRPAWSGTALRQAQRPAWSGTALRLAHDCGPDREDSQGPGDRLAGVRRPATSSLPAGKRDRRPWWARWSACRLRGSDRRGSAGPGDSRPCAGWPA